jgi:hypothetical protein
MVITFRQHRVYFYAVLVTLPIVAALIWRSTTWTPHALNLASTSLTDTYRPVVNLPWVRYGADFGGVAKWQTPGISEDSKTIDSWLTTLASQGTTAIVWFLLSDGRGSLEFDDSGYVRGLTPKVLSDYRAALDLLKKHRMQVIWVIADFKIANPPVEEKGVQMFGRADLIEDERKQSSFIEKGIVPIVRENYDLAQIAGWIVINEPEHLLRDGSVSEESMRRFVERTATEIRHYSRKPVSIGNADLTSMIHLSDLAGLDYFVFHDYKSTLPPPVSYIQRFLIGVLHRSTAQKPIFIGEYNLGFPPTLDMRRFLEAAKALGYAGAWPWSIHNRVDVSGTAAIDENPQFDELGPYWSVFRSDSDPNAVRSSGAVAALRTDNSGLHLSSQRAELLLGTNLRIREIESGDAIVSQRNRAMENLEWRQRILDQYLPIFRQQLSKALNERAAAQQSLSANEAWLRRALPAEADAARSAEATSQQWVIRVERQIVDTEDNIRKQEADLREATARWRGHSYSEEEIATELAWLRWFSRALQEESMPPAVPRQ